MNITIKVAPKLMQIKGIFGDEIVAGTKDQLINKITESKCFKMSSKFGSGYASYKHDATHVRVFNLEKRRPVIKTVTDAKSLKNGIKRKVVTPGHWIAYVYDFPIDVLVAAKKKVNQGSRNFVIVDK